MYSDNINLTPSHLMTTWGRPLLRPHAPRCGLWAWSGTGQSCVSGNWLGTRAQGTRWKRPVGNRSWGWSWLVYTSSWSCEERIRVNGAFKPLICTFQVEVSIPEWTLGVRVIGSPPIQRDYAGLPVVDEDVGATLDEGHRRAGHHLHLHTVVTVDHAAYDLDLQTYNHSFCLSHSRSAWYRFRRLWKCTLAVAV